MYCRFCLHALVGRNCVTYELINDTHDYQRRRTKS